MFRFEPKGAGVEEQFRQIASDQITRALVEIREGERDIAETIHKLRRHSKKVRGLLQLVRPVFTGFDQENAAIRDAAATLAHARDAEVTLQTLDKLAALRPEDAAPLMRIRDRLAAQKHDTIDPNVLEPFENAFAALKDRAEKWTLDESGWDAIGPGLERTYRTAQRRMRKAIRSKTAFDHHEWRKSNKHHGYHIDLLDNLADEVLGPELKASERLSEHLGRHHDLAVLGGRMDHEGEAFGATADRDVLKRLIAEDTAGLEKSAHVLGQQVFAEKPSALLERYTAYWRMHED
jgi:CHAD domain-containing protein